MNAVKEAFYIVFAPSNFPIVWEADWFEEDNRLFEAGSGCFTVEG